MWPLESPVVGHNRETFTKRSLMQVKQQAGDHRAVWTKDCQEKSYGKQSEVTWRFYVYKCSPCDRTSSWNDGVNHNLRYAFRNFDEEYVPTHKILVCFECYLTMHLTSYRVSNKLKRKEQLCSDTGRWNQEQSETKQYQYQYHKSHIDWLSVEAIHAVTVTAWAIVQPYTRWQ
jgi:hypothetical protein